MESKNPAFGERFTQGFSRSDVMELPMTAMGTASKTLVLMLLLSMSAGLVWMQVSSGNTGIVTPALLVGGLGGFVVALVTCFKPLWSPVTAPIYAVLEGLALGAVSAMVNTRYHGLPQQAVGITITTAIVMFVLYRARIITVTDRMRSIASAALLGLVVMYLANMVLSMFGVPLTFLTDSSPLSIGISVAASLLAAFFLLLDMDLVEQMVASGAPKRMEWYGAFGFVLTLVWLYLEVLRLLEKLRGK